MYTVVVITLFSFISCLVICYVLVVYTIVDIIHYYSRCYPEEVGQA